jgi:SAM-dependent methyltransferase
MKENTYPPFFKDLLEHTNFPLSQSDLLLSQEEQLPSELDVRNWMPLTQKSVHSLLQEIRQKTTSIPLVLKAMQSLSQLHAENGYEQEARLLAEFSGLQAPVPYDTVHATCGYEFSSATRPSTFAKLLIENNFPNGRVVVDVGCGNGRDAIGYAEADARVAMGIDSSPFIIEKFRERISGLDPALQARITATCIDMQNLLSFHPELEKKVDLVTWNSVLHLFPRRQLVDYLEKISNEILSTNGIIGASVKTPASFFNTSGILLEEWNGGNSRICIDGQCRWFEEADSFIETIRSQFSDVLHTRVRKNQRPNNTADERIDVVAQKVS